MEFSRLDDFLKKITDTIVPGVDCSVYVHHKPVYRGCYGYADVAEKRPITTDTMYYLYSASKLLTCVAALQLHERGEFHSGISGYEDCTQVAQWECGVSSGNASNSDSGSFHHDGRTVV